MGTVPKTPRFFDNDFIENLPKEFPTKAEKINERLTEVSNYCPPPFEEQYSLWIECLELKGCWQLLGTIKEQHQLSFDMPVIFEVPEKYKKLDLDLVNDILKHNIGQEGMDEITESFFRLKECVSDLSAQAEKKQAEASCRKSYRKSLVDAPKD